MDKVTYRSNNLPRREIKKSVAPAILSNWVIKAIFLGVSIFLLYNVGHSINITVQKVNILKNARQEVEKLRVTNLELDTQLQNMQSTEYIEVEARDRLNYSGTNDLTFVIPDTLMNSAKEKLAVILKGDTEDSKETVIQRWAQLITNGV